MIETLLRWLLPPLLGALLGGSAVWWYRDRAEDRQIATEALAEAQKLQGINREREKDDHASDAAAAWFEDQRQKSEALHAKALTDQWKALQRPISCPTGGSVTLGDLPIPAAALDGLRRVAGQDRVPEAGAGTPEPDR